MLALLSLLAMLSDWVCFSVAPIPGLTQLAYSGVHPASLVTLFLFTNVFFCLVEPIIVKRYGLRDTIIFGAMLMAIGCILRSGLPGYPTTSAGVVMLGTVFVGAAQPFFQCTPAMLAAEWFGPNERTLATTIAINANQIGIAMSYICGAYLVHDVGDFHGYFLILAFFACGLFVCTAAFFRSRPPTPPSRASEGRSTSNTSVSLSSSVSSLNNATATDMWTQAKILFSSFCFPAGGVGRSEVEKQFRDVVDLAAQIRRLIITDGFVHALAAFVVSIGITNVISTFLDHMLEHLGFHQHTVGIIGAAFQVAIMIGSLIFGSYVDHTKQYVPATVFCKIPFLQPRSQRALYCLPPALMRFHLLLPLHQVLSCHFFSCLGLAKRNFMATVLWSAFCALVFLSVLYNLSQPK